MINNDSIHANIANWVNNNLAATTPNKSVYSQDIFSNGIELGSGLVIRVSIVNDTDIAFNLHHEENREGKLRSEELLQYTIESSVSFKTKSKNNNFSVSFDVKTGGLSGVVDRDIDFVNQVLLGSLYMSHLIKEFHKRNKEQLIAEFYSNLD